MRTAVDRRLIDEVERYSLRFYCDDCAHFGDGKCTLGWPDGERRARGLAEGSSIVFCKEFEPA